ncbi:MAG TPA: hypothetical protein VLS27_13540 [Gammaproteobacteria bacterium]|nr:hypothetical protein [Gammaproteobacteria bacterium]
MKRFKKMLAVAVAGAMFQLGGCGPIVQDLVLSATWEFIWDNDSTFDFFGDDGPGLIQ